MEVCGINHITLRVSDLPKSVEFYRDILGAKNIHKGNTDVYLDFCGTWLCLLEIKNAKPMNKDQTGVDHVAFSIKEEKFPRAVKQLKENKVHITRGPLERGGGMTVSFTDPDGNELELFTGSLYERMKSWK
ncbi:VOC family protein [Fictibacillus sp. UD]|uniref:VOC family protein n=1 Tax=Fictibacillus sp. UD TaxID=3038777 RepID=UPI003744BE10